MFAEACVAKDSDGNSYTPSCCSWKEHGLLHHSLQDSKHQSTQVFERLLFILYFIGGSPKLFRKQLHNGAEYFMKSHLHILQV